MVPCDEYILLYGGKSLIRPLVADVPAMHAREPSMHRNIELLVTLRRLICKDMNVVLLQLLTDLRNALRLDIGSRILPMHLHC